MKVRKFATLRVNIKCLNFCLYEKISHQDLWGFIMHVWIVEVECGSGNVEHIRILKSWLSHQSAWPLCLCRVSLAVDCPWGWTVLILSLKEEAEWKHHSYFGSSTNINSSSSISYYLMSHILPTVSFKPPGYHFVQQSGKSNGTLLGWKSNCISLKSSTYYLNVRKALGRIKAIKCPQGVRHCQKYQHFPIIL